MASSRYKAIYIPEEMEETWKKLKKIAAREFPDIRARGATSRLLQKLITEYVRLHEPGNPQQTLPHLFKNGKPYRAEQKRKGYQRFKGGWLEVEVNNHG